VEVKSLLMPVGDTSRADRNVQAAYYDKDTKRLYVMFKHNLLYVYKDVPEAVGEGIFSAESGGKYLNAFVKPFYPYERLE
jgi:hypothetical protein